MTKEQYVVITPARDEAAYLPRMIASLVAQTHPPTEWIIVDDGSRDETAALARAAAQEHSWIRVVTAPDRGVRNVGAGVVEAFNVGFAAIQHTEADFLCLIDADIVLPERYFEILFTYFAKDPKLGIACGGIVERVGDQLVELRHEPEMVFGAIKCWRRECFKMVGGLELSVGWDGIDVFQAIRHGWKTAVLPDPALTVLHLRRMGTSHKSILHGCSRRGRALRYNRSHPVWVMGSVAYRMFDRPYIVAGMCVLAGYCLATIRRTPRIADAGFGTFLRQWQMNKLARRLVPGSRASA